MMKSTMMMKLMLYIKNRKGQIIPSIDKDIDKRDFLAAVENGSRQ